MTSAPWTAPIPDGHSLVKLPAPVLDALADGDLELARASSYLADLPAEALGPYLVGEECRGVWTRRRRQIQADPGDALWVTRLLLCDDSVVGRAGFHGPPDAAGMVEVGYAVDPAHRRQGHARAALGILLEVARTDSRVLVVRATVRPDNLPSRALVDQNGFLEVGLQWDVEDGVETVLERPAT
ncbi:N-acetyltransferase [Nakamurella silvestris]|nr:N-acetyltransferase [Nakamurella silvestris]